jgi:hypothetical protein
VRHVDVPLNDVWRTGLTNRGIAPGIIDGLHDLYTNYRHEGTADLGNGIQRILGRPPRSAATFARELLRPAALGGVGSTGR